MTTIAGRQLGEYALGECIGQGGMAEVYRATHPRYGTVAVKVLLPVFTADQEAQKRFLREAETLRTLNHPNIVRLYEAGALPDPTSARNTLSYMALEYLPGGTLLDQMQHSAPMAQEPLLSWMASIGRALAHAHGRGLIHRDLKPSNIMFRANGTPVLTDFGIAHTADHSRLTSTGVLIGTIVYMAPELLDGAPADARSDLYALGLIMYEALTNVRPFHQHEAGIATLIKKVLTMEPTPVRHLTRKVTPQVASLIERCIGKKPGLRPQTAAEFVTALDTVRQANSTGRWRRKLLVGSAYAGGVLALALGIQQVVSAPGERTFRTTMLSSATTLPTAMTLRQPTSTPRLMPTSTFAPTRPVEEPTPHAPTSRAVHSPVPEAPAARRPVVQATAVRTTRIPPTSVPLSPSKPTPLPPASRLATTPVPPPPPPTELPPPPTEVPPLPPTEVPLPPTEAPPPPTEAPPPSQATARPIPPPAPPSATPAPLPSPTATLVPPQPSATPMPSPPQTTATCGSGGRTCR